MVWQFPECMGFVEGELQVHSSSKCLKMFNESFWIFLHVYLVKFFLSYWIFLCFYLVNFFFPYWQLKLRTAPPCFLADFFIPPLAPSINHFQCGFERTGHWLCSSPFEWGKKKDPFIQTKADLPWTHPFCKLLTVLSLPVTLSENHDTIIRLSVWKLKMSTQLTKGH